MRLSDFYIPADSLSAAVPLRGYVRRVRTGGHYPICMIHGCAGLGKTVFLAQLAEEWGAPAVYIALRAEDNSEEHLAAHLMGALSTASGINPDGESEVTPAQLAAHFVRTVSEGGYSLLIDNIDAITDAPAQRLLEQLFRPAAGGIIRAAAAGRTVPGLMLRHILGGVCAEVRARDLFFTEEETAANIRLQLPPESPVLSADSGLPLPAAAHSLNAFAGGWPAAEVMILTEVARSREKELDLSSAAERSHLRSFIAYNILDGLGEAAAAYVRHTALLPHCGEDVCRAVLHENHGGEHLAALIARGILVCADCPAAWPDYPPAVRQALIGMIPAAERRRLLDEAVSFYVTVNRMAEAVTLLDEYDDADTVEKLLGRFGGRLIENREFELIGYCAEIIERHRMPSDAAALGVLAQYYYYKGDYAEMERALNAADSTFGRENVYSACRGLYNGLLKYEKNPELYADNVCRFAQYLRQNGHPMPFLHPREEELLAKILRSAAPPAEKPLRMHRFGGLSLTLRERGTELPWRTKKACEFMAYMIEQGGRPVERDRLLGLLWQDNMPESAVAMLHNIIYSLRRELPASAARDFISYKGKCYAADLSLIDDGDADILDACRAVREKDTAALVRHAQLFASYWGKYLANLDCGWAAELREHYDRLFVDGCLMLAAHFHGSGGLDRELSFLKNAAAVDPYSEQIIREILCCYAAMGYPNKAKARYDEYCALIGEELGIEPSKWLKREFLACFSENRL